ncbi:hypothetical protein EMIT0194P_70094 [Pseudomonas serbica]
MSGRYFYRRVLPGASLRMRIRKASGTRSQRGSRAAGAGVATLDRGLVMSKMEAQTRNTSLAVSIKV